ncbi:MAG: carbon storage regulator CsrA [Planctomycetaceae bacterium]|jgi:carbon storage regulator|nr:carbon storage regulator CsrA [Planctomycetaceae bacterium]
MLVLSRKAGERIQIGNDVTLTVVSVKGNRVRLGIEAPQECRIVRDEILWEHEIIEFELEEEKSEAELMTC